jgi:hypothetical protein
MYLMKGFIVLVRFSTFALLIERVTFRGPRARPAIRQWENRLSLLPSSKVFTTTAFLPACRPASTITTFPDSAEGRKHAVSQRRRQDYHHRIAFPIHLLMMAILKNIGDSFNYLAEFVDCNKRCWVQLHCGRALRWRARKQPRIFYLLTKHCLPRNDSFDQTKLVRRAVVRVGTEIVGP